MMARKLSVIALTITVCAFVAAANILPNFASAEDEIRVAAPKTVVDNPFVAGEAKPRTVAEEPQAAQRGPVTYQNPFAHMSKAPPIDSSLRPGPISRWQHPQVPAAEPSAVKSAVLTQPVSQLPANNAEPVHINWAQLPPAVSLKQHAFSDETATLSHLADPDPIITSTPSPLTQPESVAEHSASSTPLGFEPPILPSDAAAHPTAGSPVIDVTLPAKTAATATNISSSFSIPANEHDCELTSHQEDASAVVSDSESSPKDWLNQAQDAATHAETPDEFGTVVTLCDRGLQGTPSNGESSSLRQLSAWAHNRRGEILADAQKSDDAIQDFQAAISMDPKCSLAIHNRGVTLAQRNQFGAALRDFNRVIELNPGLAVAYRNRAELLAALGRMEEAIADYNQAVSSLPEDPSLLCARAHAYQRVGNFANATADINRAVELAPHDPDLITQRGNLEAEQGKFEKARQDFRDAIAKGGTRAEAYRSLAWMQATCSDPRYRDAGQALAHAQKAAKLSPEDDYLVLDTLAAANACSGNFANAIDLEEKALTAAPRDLSTPLEQRLALYQHNKSFTTAPPKSQVQTASHEAPTRKGSSAAQKPVPQTR